MGVHSSKEQQGRKRLRCGGFEAARPGEVRRAANARDIGMQHHTASNSNELHKAKQSEAVQWLVISCGVGDE